MEASEVLGSREMAKLDAMKADDLKRIKEEAQAAAQKALEAFTERTGK